MNILESVAWKYLATMIDDENVLSRIARRIANPENIQRRSRSNRQLWMLFSTVLYCFRQLQQFRRSQFLVMQFCATALGYKAEHTHTACPLTCRQSHNVRQVAEVPPHRDEVDLHWDSCLHGGVDCR